MLKTVRSTATCLFLLPSCHLANAQALILAEVVKTLDFNATSVPELQQAVNDWKKDFSKHYGIIHIRQLTISPTGDRFIATIEYTEE
jgi:hypothetical protein